MAKTCKKCGGSGRVELAAERLSPLSRRVTRWGVCPCPAGLRLAKKKAA